jgi:hypothetical protein
MIPAQARSCHAPPPHGEQLDLEVDLASPHYPDERAEVPAGVLSRPP